MPLQSASTTRGPDSLLKLQVPPQNLLQLTLERLLSLDQLKRLYAELPPTASTDEFLTLALAKINLNYDAAGALSDIPKLGRLVVVANHPFGAVEGLILAQWLRRIRPDVKVVANYLLGGIPELQEIFIPVDPFGGPGAMRRNVGSLRAAREWLQNEGCVVLFPAGTVSHLHWRRGLVTDPAWNHGAAWLSRSAQSPVLPVYFHGTNSLAFQVAGLIQPKLRTAMLPRELIRKQNTRIRLTVGKIIGAQRITSFDDEAALTKYLRIQTYLLGESPSVAVRKVGRRRFERNVASVVDPVSPQILQHEIAVLPRTQQLLQHGPFEVYTAEARQIPQMLQEIGRLRELTFRAVGEGTGYAADIDLFDRYYEHLFVWQRERREVVGAYRLARADVVCRAKSERGLYTHSLFKYPASFVDCMGPALELGRSFVRQEYQRSHPALLLLWQGICAYVLRNPRYATLFGAVSISGEFRTLSQQMLVEFLSARHMDRRLAGLVRARRPFRRSTVEHELVHGVSALRDIDELSQMVAELEPDGKGVPVLLRHYLKLGGRLLGFHVDPHFNRSLDGLIVVDFRVTDPAVLRRYMGREGTDAFFEYHASRRDDWRLAS